MHTVTETTRDSGIHACMGLVASYLSIQETLNSMTEESFDGHKKALEVKRLDKPKKLKAESKKYWTEILMNQYHFNRGTGISGLA